MAESENGFFIWYELMTRDAKAAIAFFTEVIGWKTQPFGEGDDYTMWVASQGPLGGVAEIDEAAAAAGARPGWIGHVRVGSVDATCALAKKLGGVVHKAPEDIPSVGRFALVADPQGAVLSVFTPSFPMEEHDGSKDGEFRWSELLTSDSAAALQFYSQLFGWKLIREMPMGPGETYRIYGLGERGIGGMMTLPKGNPMPPLWLYYTGVSDLDAAIARAKKRGATLMNGPMEVPDGARIAQLMGPEGVPFALHEMRKA